VELLLALAVQGHRFATLTNDPGDAANAVAFDVRVEAAKTEYQDHQKQQAVVDARAADARH
jgi:ATP phosphoribosyltransferase regulatory subunit HisZ